MKPHAFHAEASQEYAQAAEYYANIAPRLGMRFHHEIESLISEVRRQPSGRCLKSFLIRWFILTNQIGYGSSR